MAAHSLGLRPWSGSSVMCFEFGTQRESRHDREPHTSIGQIFVRLRVGLSLALVFVEAGFPVVGLEIVQVKIVHGRRHVTEYPKGIGVRPAARW